MPDRGERTLGHMTETSSEVDEPGDTTTDPLREKLLVAAAKVFASKGYWGTKIQDIVREAGLSAGAVYGRFDSKKDLLVEAVVTWAERGTSGFSGDHPVAEDIVHYAMVRGPLSDQEAMQVEAYVAARREPEVADALAEARLRSRAVVEPLIEAALADGTVPPDADIDSILYFLQAVNLGLLLQRGAGMSAPDPAAWERFIELMVASMANAANGVDPT